MFARLILATWFALASFGALAQSSIQAFPPGLFQNTAAMAPAGGGSAYVGPGNVGIAFTAYYGLRAYSAATRGNKLVNVCNSTGGVDVGCADMFSDASTGKLVTATIAGITCPGANCTIKTYYDLTGGNACSGLTCDVSQATIASRDTLGTSCAPTTAGYCAMSVGSRYLNPNNYVFSAQPLFMSSVVSVTNSGTQQVTIGNNSGQAWQLFYWNHSSQQEAGITTDGTATILWSNPYTNGYHSLSGLSASGAGASYIALDSTVTTGTISVAATTSLIIIHGDAFNDNLASGDVFLESGFSASAPASTVATTLNANEKTFWGWP